MSAPCLAERVLHLPQELRDIVYSHFWHEETVHALPLARVLESGGVLTKIPQIADKKLVGEQIAAEAVDWLYNNSLHLTINPPSGLPGFLSDDIFATGVRAEACSLRRLTIKITDVGCDVSGLQALTTAKLRNDFHLHIRIGLGSKSIKDIVHLGVRLAELPIPASDAMIVAENVEPWDVKDLMGESYLAWEDALHGVL
ncbi:hypothetical protein HBH98_244620 [Parastagonospora nodorum]|nr:hypothetical protein HBH98_244620 [Parastagonospora nodorum]KAH4356515.1 hypothetical protein HBH97_228920 [Parastagonospora nodorum]KAH4370623.1 hypothetical protein HBH99_238880 [Parastagonospora nodorum]KAH5159334.1 hypothetical protein HBH69_060100 [Parastagonospora nodorum]KAH5568320.1 hypothetical protein HBI25_047960 [Parastagonospora nodorum]